MTKKAKKAKVSANTDFGMDEDEGNEGFVEKVKETLHLSDDEEDKTDHEKVTKTQAEKSEKVKKVEESEENVPVREELPVPPFSHGDVVQECQAINGFTPHFMTVSKYHQENPDIKTAHALAVLICDDAKDEGLHGWWGPSEE